MSFKKILFVTCLLLSIESYAAWYTSRVAEVSAWEGSTGSPLLFIRTELNPNPANCPSKWAGAAWTKNDKSMDLAASIALTAKVTASTVKFAIDDDRCSSNGLPVMLWLQVQ